MRTGKMKVALLLFAAAVAVAVSSGTQNGGSEVFLAKLMHRFSDDLNAVRVSRRGREVNDVAVPRKRSSEYYQRLLSSDLERQTVKLGPHYQIFYPSHGNSVLQLGNYWGWLHYTWIDVGSPNVSFLVALDTGSDLLWVPCDCKQCAPLSASNHSNPDKGLKEYNPSSSTTSKLMNCSHHLCELGSTCTSSDQTCPYTVNYETKNTSTSGFLVEDSLHLIPVSSNNTNKFVRAPVVIGCGSKQTGRFLEVTAPDGIMGLGLGNISVPRFLAKAGLGRNSFSLCFNEDNNGRIYFGDQGIASQNTTPFLALEERNEYKIGVKECCIGNSCLEQTDFKVLIDSGTSFTYLPSRTYEKLVVEFDRQINANKSSFNGSQWDYCYMSSSLAEARIPSISLKFDANNSFVVLNPVLFLHVDEGSFGCLPIQPIDDDVGTIGQNFMIGYRMVFDGENMKLGWSHYDCRDLADEKMPTVTSSTSSSPRTLPSSEEQSSPNHIPTDESLRPMIVTPIFMKLKQYYFAGFLFPFWLIACMFLRIFISLNHSRFIPSFNLR